MAEVKNPDVETWESVVSGLRGIVVWGEKGEWTVDDIEGGSSFFITPDARRRQARMCKDQADNPFTNGAFRMLEAVAEDPNSQSLLEEDAVPDDDELEKLLDLPMAKFTAGLNAIEEPTTVERLYRLARKNEVTGRKADAIGKRLKELDPHAVVVGDKLSEGRENPDDQRDGPVQIETDGDPKPREYDTGIEN